MNYIKINKTNLKETITSTSHTKVKEKKFKTNAFIHRNKISNNYSKIHMKFYNAKQFRKITKKIKF